MKSFTMIFKKSRSGSKGQGDGKKLQEGIEKSFEAIVKYCEEPE